LKRRREVTMLAGGYSERVATGTITVGDPRAGACFVEMAGEHDIYTAPDLRERLREVIESGSSVVVDLSGASFIDSSILGALLNARQWAIDRKQGFAICLDQGSDLAVRRVFEMTGLTATLPVLDTRDQAAAVARSPRSDAPEDHEQPSEQ
jgi:anti-sigma B factor antagonist